MLNLHVKTSPWQVFRVVLSCIWCVLSNAAFVVDLLKETILFLRILVLYFIGLLRFALDLLFTASFFQRTVSYDPTGYSVKGLFDHTSSLFNYMFSIIPSIQHRLPRSSAKKSQIHVLCLSKSEENIIVVYYI